MSFVETYFTIQKHLCNILKRILKIVKLEPMSNNEAQEEEEEEKESVLMAESEFMAECEHAALMADYNIGPEVYGYFVENNTGVLIMEYFPSNLFNYLIKKNP